MSDVDADVKFEDELEDEVEDEGELDNFPVATTTRVQPSLTRFEAVLTDAKLNQKGEWVLNLKVPWSDRNAALALTAQHGVMLDWRVTRKTGG